MQMEQGFLLERLVQMGHKLYENLLLGSSGFTVVLYVYYGIQVVKCHNSIITCHDPISIRLNLTWLGRGSLGKGNRVLA